MGFSPKSGFQRHPESCKNPDRRIRRRCSASAASFSILLIIGAFRYAILTQA
jgi:hypothetical protein